MVVGGDDRSGEACYYHDAMFCVGFGDRLHMGIIVKEDDPLLTTERGRLVRGNGGFINGGLDARYFQHAPISPFGYRQGLQGTDATYLGTDPKKMWPEVVRESRQWLDELKSSGVVRFTPL